MLGVFMEIDAQDQFLQSSMDQCIVETRREENIVASGGAREHIIEFRNQIEDLTKRLGDMKEEVGRASQRASTAESQQDKALVQLSALKESCRQCNETRA